MCKSSITLYSIITHFYTFEILYRVFENIMKNGAFAQNALFSIIHSKVFKTLLKFFLNFSIVSKNSKLCHDLKIAYGVKGCTF